MTCRRCARNPAPHAAELASQKEGVLFDLLSNPDMRIRQKAQLELATRGAKGAAEFSRAIVQTDNQLARIHGVWGTGQLAREKKSYASPLLALLKDKDAELVAQAAKVLRAMPPCPKQGLCWYPC